MSMKYMRSHDMRPTSVYFATVDGDDNVLVYHNGNEILSFKKVNGSHRHKPENVSKVRPAAIIDSMGTEVRDGEGTVFYERAPFAESLVLDQWNNAFKAPQHVTYLHGEDSYLTAPVGTVAGDDHLIVKVKGGRWLYIEGGAEATDFQTYRRVVHWGSDNVRNCNSESIWGPTVLVCKNHDGNGVIPFGVAPSE